MKHDTLSGLDTFIENERSDGMSDAMIAKNLATASGLVRTKQWDAFHYDMASKGGGEDG